MVRNYQKKGGAGHPCPVTLLRKYALTITIQKAQRITEDIGTSRYTKGTHRRAPS